MKRFAIFVTVAYSLLLLYWMFFAFGRGHSTLEGYHYNLVPFSTIGHYFAIADSHQRLSAINLIGNIAVFVPFGMLLPLSARMSMWKWVALYTGAIAVLELLQLLSRRGTFDVDDIILNVAGYLVGNGMLSLFLWTFRGANNPISHQR